jgi:hypothetical protein
MEQVYYNSKLMTQNGSDQIHASPPTISLTLLVKTCHF